jgi:hypothetical protein
LQVAEKNSEKLQAAKAGDAELINVNKVAAQAIQTCIGKDACE